MASKSSQLDVVPFKPSEEHCPTLKDTTNEKSVQREQQPRAKMEEQLRDEKMLESATTIDGSKSVLDLAVSSSVPKNTAYPAPITSTTDESKIAVLPAVVPSKSESAVQVPMDQEKGLATCSNALQQQDEVQAVKEDNDNEPIQAATIKGVKEEAKSISEVDDKVPADICKKEDEKEPMGRTVCMEDSSLTGAIKAEQAVTSSPNQRVLHQKTIELDEEKAPMEDEQQATSKEPSAAPEPAREEKNTEEEQEELMKEEEWREEFKSILDELDHNGEFCIGKKVALPGFHPKITIDGLGDRRLAFPLPISQAEELRYIAEKAPFGKGTETVLDEEVRKAWQIDPSLVSFADLNVWEDALKNVVKEAVASLGLSPIQQQNTHATLYKMLLYESGGHFKKHRDTEKEQGMFGTLVLQLPSKFEGGSLVIQHGGETKTLDFSAESDDNIFATAFYADCEHELRPVTKGFRLCLVYNLVLSPPKNSELPSAHVLTKQACQVRRLASQWGGACSEIVQGYLLEHKYTECSLQFQDLKGRDKEVVNLLRGARGVDGKPLFVVCLFLLEKKETGTPSSSGYGRRNRRYGYDDDDEEDEYDGMEEVHDSATKIKYWIGPDDEKISNFDLSFDLERCLLLDQDTDFDELFGESPDDEEFEGYTGNAGPTLEYWYYRSAVVFWPADQLSVASSAGLPFMLSYLNSADESETLAIGTKVMELIENSRGMTVNDAVLRGLRRTGNAPLIARALKRVLSFPSDEFVKQLVEIMRTTKDDNLNALALELLQKTLSNTARFEEVVCYSCMFIDELERHGLVATLLTGRELLLNTIVPRSEILMKSGKAATMVAKVAFFCPSLLGEYIDMVIQYVSLSTVGAVLSTFIGMQGGSANEHVFKLAQARVAHLIRATKNGIPTFSWRQPGARFVGSQANSVNAFLHGDQEAMVFQFDGTRHARNWASKYFGYSFHGSGYSARATPGIVSSTHVTVTKTGQDNQGMFAQYNLDVQELNRLVSVFGSTVGSLSVPAEAKRAATTTQVAASEHPKRAKIASGEGVDNAIALAEPPRHQYDDGNKDNPIEL